MPFYKSLCLSPPTPTHSPSYNHIISIWYILSPSYCHALSRPTITLFPLLLSRFFPSYYDAVSPPTPKHCTLRISHAFSPSTHTYSLTPNPPHSSHSTNTLCTLLLPALFPFYTHALYSPITALSLPSYSQALTPPTPKHSPLLLPSTHPSYSQTLYPSNISRYFFPSYSHALSPSYSPALFPFYYQALYSPTPTHSPLLHSFSLPFSPTFSPPPTPILSSPPTNTIFPLLLSQSLSLLYYAFTAFYRLIPQTLPPPRFRSCVLFHHPNTSNTSPSAPAFYPTSTPTYSFPLPPSAFSLLYLNPPLLPLPSSHPAVLPRSLPLLLPRSRETVALSHLLHCHPHTLKLSHLQLPCSPTQPSDSLRPISTLFLSHIFYFFILSPAPPFPQVPTPDSFVLIISSSLLPRPVASSSSYYFNNSPFQPIQ